MVQMDVHWKQYQGTGISCSIYTPDTVHTVVDNTVLGHSYWLFISVQARHIMYVLGIISDQDMCCADKTTWPQE